MSDNTLTRCWRLEQVGQHSSDEDDLFSSIKSKRSEGTGELEGYLACVSVNMDLLNAFQNIKKLSKNGLKTQYLKKTQWPTCLGRLRATLQLCWIAVQCKASPDELYSPWKSAAAQTQQEVCSLML